jgi:hypothetical protein
MPAATLARRTGRKAAPRARKADGGAGAKRRTAAAKPARPARSAAAVVAPRANSGRTAAGSRKTRVAAPDFAFSTVLAERGPTGLWPHLFLSPEASAWLGRRGMVDLIVNVNGVMFRRTARPDGAGGHFVVFNAEMRERSGVEPGDRLRVGLAADHAPNVVNTPRELEQALESDPAARSAYGSMPPSHRHAYVQFVQEAKRPETKVRRIQQALRMMVQWGEERHAGKKR